jgi:hypothetical protein
MVAFLVRMKGKERAHARARCQAGQDGDGRDGLVCFTVSWSPPLSNDLSHMMAAFDFGRGTLFGLDTTDKR